MSGVSFPISQTLGITTAQHTSEAAVPQVVPSPVPTTTIASPEQQPVVLEHGNLRASFAYDQQLKQVIIILQQEETGEVVQQFPPEQIIRMLSGMMESLGNQLDAKG